MSFFNELISYFSVDDLSCKLSISMIVGVGLVVVGKCKIETMDENLITISGAGKRIDLVGKGMKIKSVAKGEIIVFGEIENVQISEAKR